MKGYRQRFGITGIERRVFPVRELRVAGEGDQPRKINGYAAVFNELSEDLGGFIERIKPGAFAKTLQEADVRALWNHDPNYVLGRTKPGTLRLAEDQTGLAIEIDPPMEAQWARDLMVSMIRGDVDQMSFGFRTIRDEWVTAGEQIVRTLLEVQLYDVSPVTFPAYPQTEVNVRGWEPYVGAIQRLRAGQATPEDLRMLDAVLPLPADDQSDETIVAGASAPGQAPHPDAGEQRAAQERNQMLRRRLALIEAS